MNIGLIKSLLTLRTGIAFVVGLAIGYIIVEKVRGFRDGRKHKKENN